MARRPYGTNPSTRFNGPLVGSNNSNGGLFTGIPLGVVDRLRVPYHTWVEDFSVEFADGQLETMGATKTAVGAVAADTELVSAENRFLLVTPGTAQDTGTEIQFGKIAPTAASLQNQFDVPGLITDASTNCDFTELIWACRFGVTSDTTAWDGKVIMGWLTDDTSLMTPGTGVPSIAAGGGAGFHIGETGVFSYFSQNGAVTAAGTTTGMPNILTEVAAVGVGVVVWHEVGVRLTWNGTYAAGTGRSDFYLDNRLVGTIVNGLPMQGAEAYASSIGVLNGPARDSLLTVDWLFTAINGGGR